MFTALLNFMLLKFNIFLNNLSWFCFDCKFYLDVAHQQ